MHAGNLFGDQTTGSYFGEIDKCYFVTGSSFPCLAVFKPLSKNAEVLPENEEDAIKYWLKREKLNRHIMSGNIDQKEYLKEAQELQNEFFNLAVNCGEKNLEKVSRECFEKEDKFVDSWLEKVKDKKIHIKKGGLYFKNYWNKKTERMEEEYRGF